MEIGIIPLDSYIFNPNEAYDKVHSPSGDDRRTYRDWTINKGAEGRQDRSIHLRIVPARTVGCNGKEFA